jgi:hypothetical protein
MAPIWLLVLLTMKSPKKDVDHSPPLEKRKLSQEERDRREEEQELDFIAGQSRCLAVMFGAGSILVAMVLRKLVPYSAGMLVSYLTVFGPACVAILTGTIAYSLGVRRYRKTKK